MTLLELLKLLREKLALVIILPLACALVTAVVSWAFLPNEYTSSSSMYVLQRQDTATAVTNSDLTASQMITNDVAKLLTSDRIIKDTAKALQMTPEAMQKNYKIKVTSETTTRVLSVSVTGRDAASTAIIANRLAKEVSTVAIEVMDLKSVNVIDEAQTPDAPSGPARTMYTAVAFLAGLFIAVALVVMLDMFNVTIKSAEEAQELFDLPVLGKIPTMGKEGK
ncbi:MAG: Wzz/FepE/Etk N-terminal domain-containing protein [Raoultibacter sp.]